MTFFNQDKNKTQNIQHFIQHNQPNSPEFLPYIAEFYKEQIKEDWININDTNTPNNTYFEFAEGNYGMLTYGFYKTKNTYFLIKFFCNQVVEYYYINNSNILSLHQTSDNVT